jgi:hypothetical protein
MSRPSFLEGALIALIGAVAGTLAFATSAWLVPANPAVRLMTAGLALAYLAYLLGRSRGRIGRPTVLVLWVLAALGLWVFAPPLPVYLSAHLGALSLVRSLYFQEGPLSALADLGLTFLSLIAGVGAFLHTGSLFLAIWTLLLVQALFVLVPARLGSGPEAPREEDRFARAERAAEEAVRKLTSAD